MGEHLSVVHLGQALCGKLSGLWARRCDKLVDMYALDAIHGEDSLGAVAGVDRGNREPIDVLPLAVEGCDIRSLL